MTNALQTAHHVATRNFTLHTDIFSTVIGVFTVIATIILAVYTAMMAKRTRQLAEETKDMVTHSERQAAAAEGALLAATRPWLVTSKSVAIEQPSPDLVIPSVKVESAGSQFPIYLSARFTNVGQGLALIDTSNSWLCARGQTNNPDEFLPYANLFTDSPVLPSGEELVVECQVRKTAAQWNEITLEKFCFPRTLGGGNVAPGEFLIKIAYTDAAGKNPVRAEVRVLVRDTFECEPHLISYFNGREVEPFSQVRVGLPG